MCTIFSKRPRSRSTGIPVPRLGFFHDSIPGRDHQFHRDFRPGLADRTECYTRNFVDCYCKLTLHFPKKSKNFKFSDSHLKIKSKGGYESHIYVSTWLASYSCKRQF